MSEVARTCPLGGCLSPNPSAYPPSRAERAVAPVDVGCNRLVCRDCGADVVVEKGRARCGCRETVVETPTYMARQDHGPFAPPPLPWACAGHPAPSTADFEVLGFTPGASLVADVEAALARPDVPPWHPVGQDGYLVDVRLDWEPEVASAIPTLLAALDGPEPRASLRALEVLRRRGWMPADRAVERWSKLRAQPHARFPSLDLGRFFLRGVAAHAAGGSEPHRAAARALIEAGAEEPTLRRAVEG